MHSGTSSSVAGSGRRVVARLLDAKMGAVVKGCTAAKKVEECGVESAVGERVVDVLSEAYRRGSWSDRHQSVAAVAVLAGKRRRESESHDVWLSGIASQNQGSLARLTASA